MHGCAPHSTEWRETICAYMACSLEGVPFAHRPSLRTVRRHAWLRMTRHAPVSPPVAVVVPCADVYGSSFELRNAETVRQEAFNVSNSGSRCEN